MVLDSLKKTGVYTHFIFILATLAIYYLTPDIRFDSLTSVPQAAPIGTWIIEKALNYPFLGRIINLILILLIAIQVKTISSSSDIIPRNSYLPATLISILLLFSSGTGYFACTLTVVLLLAYALHNYINMFGKQRPYLQVLNASMCIAVSSMIFPGTSIFILFLWFGLLTYSVNSWREWIITIIGFVLPFFYMLFLFFWNDNLMYIFNIYSQLGSSFKIFFSQPPIEEIISICLLFLLYLMVMLKFINEASDKVISMRKRMWLVFQFSFITILAVVISGDYFYLMLPILFIPISIMLAYSIHTQKKSFVYDLILLLFFISLLYNRVF